MLFKLFVYFGLFSQMNSGPTIIYKLKNIECLPNPKFVTNVSCHLKAVNWNFAIAQMDCELLKPLRNVSGRGKLFKKDYTNRYQPFLIDVHFNMCDVLSKKNFLSYGKIVLKVLSQYTNVNHSCPLEGHLIARGLYLHENMVPVFPVGLYQLVVDIFENYANKPREEYGTVKFYIEAMEKVKVRSKQIKSNYATTIVKI